MNVFIRSYTYQKVQAPGPDLTFGAGEIVKAKVPSACMRCCGLNWMKESSHARTQEREKGKKSDGLAAVCVQLYVRGLDEKNKAIK